LGYIPDDRICSGIVFYTSTSLTVAHCLYDYHKQEWNVLCQHCIVPARNGVWFWTGNPYDPYGILAADHMTIPDAYESTDLADVDYAVIVLKKDNTYQFPYFTGEAVGYAGLDEDSGFDDPLHDNSTITGNPGDFGGYRK
jgi:V8-like Glu-specific endopeptidase